MGLKGLFNSATQLVLFIFSRDSREPGNLPKSGVSILNMPHNRKRLLTVLRTFYDDDRRLQWLLYVLLPICYVLLLTVSTGDHGYSTLEQTFNDMLSHLLRGQFNVDPRIIGIEGFLRDGRVYSYFGIWCALLRLPLWMVGRMNVDVTRWSCLAAVSLAAVAKVRTVVLIRRRSLRNALSDWAIVLMLAYIALGGSEIGYLKVSLYQEVVFWAAAFGAIFVYFAIKGLLSGNFTTGTLSYMGLCAGLAVLDRVSTGIGLTVALVLLLVVLALQSSQDAAAQRRPMLWRLGHALTQRRFLIPLGILAVFIAATAAVNYFRWGNPTTFADFRLYLGNRIYPGRLVHLERYGAFNLRRIPLGILYYFFPAWVLHGSGGHLLFEQMRSRLIDVFELPPSSFLLTDLLPLCFIAFLPMAIRRRHAASRTAVTQCAAIAAGLLVPCLLMLTAIYMSYRYRMEFYPEIDFLAFLGLYLTVSDKALLMTFGRFRKWIAAATAVSILASFAALAMYRVSAFGPSQEFLRNGVLNYYSHPIGSWISHLLGPGTAFHLVRALWLTFRRL